MAFKSIGSIRNRRILLYLSQFYGPVGTFARIAEDLQSGIAGGERIFEYWILNPISKIKIML